MARSRPRFRLPRRLSFTREGKYFVALSLGVGFAAINTGNNLLYLVLGMMLAMIIASGVLSEVVLRKLRVARRPPARVFAGQPYLMGLRLTNEKRRAASYSVEVEDVLEGRPPERKCYFLKLPPGRTHQTAYRHTFARRGLYRLSGFIISTKFPFALFRKSAVCDAPQELVVFPAVHAVVPPEGSMGGASDSGGRRIDRRGDFYALREYQVGDDPRSIHWRKSARAGRLVIRQDEEPAARRVAVILDNHRPTEILSPDDLDRQEARVSQAASLAAHYARRGYEVGLVTRTVAVPSGAGEAHLSRILYALALLEFVADDSPLSADLPPGIERVWVDGPSGGPLALKRAG